MGCAGRYAPLLPLLFLGFSLVWVGQQGGSEDGEGTPTSLTQPGIAGNAKLALLRGIV